MRLGKCKLCLQMVDLQNSHLMPASLYKKSRIPGAPSVHQKTNLSLFVNCLNARTQAGWHCRSGLEHTASTRRTAD
jgi:hypothetical protein